MQSGLIPLGVYLHGLAGDIAAEELSQTALIASDLIKTFPEATKKVERFNERLP